MNTTQEPHKLSDHEKEELTKEYTRQRHGCCTIIRTFVITKRTFSAASGKMTPESEPLTITGPCNTPMFSNEGDICESCRQGWEVEGNKFANEQEKIKATGGQ